MIMKEFNFISHFHSVYLLIEQDNEPLGGKLLNQKHFFFSLAFFMMNISDSTSGRVTYIIVLVFWGDGKGRSIDFSGQ